MVSGALPSGACWVGCERLERLLRVVAWLQAGRVRCGWLVAADAEDLLDEVLRILAHLAAGVDGSGAVEEGDVEAVVGAGGVDEEVGGLVDVGGGDAFGSGEGFDVGVLGKLDGALHELGPDGRVRR